MDASKLLKDLAQEAGLDTEDKTDEEIATEVADMAETAKDEAESKVSEEGTEAPVTETTILDALATAAKKVAKEDEEDEGTDDEDVQG